MAEDPLVGLWARVGHMGARARKFYPRKVLQYCRRKRLPDPSGLAAFLSW